MNCSAIKHSHTQKFEMLGGGLWGFVGEREREGRGGGTQEERGGVALELRRVGEQEH